MATNTGTGKRHLAIVLVSNFLILLMLILSFVVQKGKFTENQEYVDNIEGCLGGPLNLTKAYQKNVFTSGAVVVMGGAYFGYYYKWVN